LLRRWVAEGAEYQEHWAFIPPVRETLPAVKRADWPRNAIDRFVLERLDREGLQPSPEADRRALLRRVYLDLTGLPPSPEEVAAFVADASPDAYEKAVEALLTRPAYGEHRARYWLDAARYADSHGLHTDVFRSVWPYRDYVIASLNQNKRFDQFTREQLAGDLYPAESADQVIATAFIRLGIANSESGAIEEEQRNILMTERVKAFSSVFLGLTTGCAACHDHKFDPTSQKDFYQLGAFFNNLTEFHSTRAKPDWPPSIKLPKPENKAEFDAAFARRAELQRQLDALNRQARPVVANWLARKSSPPQAVSTDGLAIRLRFDENHGTTLANSAPAARFAQTTTKGGAPEWNEDTWLWPSFRMTSTTRLDLPADAGDVSAEQPFSVGSWILPRGNGGAETRPPTGAIVTKVDSAQAFRGWGVYFESAWGPDEKIPAEPKLTDKGKLSFRLVERWPDHAIVVETAKPVFARGFGLRWTHFMATYDGSRRAAGVTLYIDGQPQDVVVVKDTLEGDIRNTVPVEFGREHPDSKPFIETRYQDFRWYQRQLSTEEARRVPLEDLVAEIVARDPSRWTEDEFKAVSDLYFATRDETAPRIAAQLQTANAELERLASGGTVCLVAADRPRLAYADVLRRGVYSQRAERVRPGLPHFLPQLPADAPFTRRGLAEWIVSPENPLTARVTVNRFWQEIFGKGLVETTSDFGLVGERPSHRALLDWLAVDFRESGWDVKAFFKQVVMSATYRQSAAASPELIARDPGNRLLARGPRFRMDAEMVRDTALAASGLLVEKVGGPSAKPYQPAGLWDALTYPESDEYKPEKYVVDKGGGLYRRSLYTYIKRQALIPNMEVFDQTARDEPCTQRLRSNTPLQALVLMNDPQWLEASRRMAERALLHASAPDARLDHLGQLLLARPWTAQERKILREALDHFRASYDSDPSAAALLIGVGSSVPDPRLAATELAPWTLVASAALNLDATLNK